MAISKNIPNLGQVNFDREENEAFLPPTFPAHLAKKYRPRPDVVPAYNMRAIPGIRPTQAKAAGYSCCKMS